MIGKAEIASMIPHAGAMCLLDHVQRWDENSIGCVANSHRSAQNPLSRLGQLNAVCGIEYAAQAMAVHGRLAGAVGKRPQVGYLASIRDMRCRAARLDKFAGDLLIEAERLMGDEERVIYRFTVSCDGKEILSGRTSVVLQIGPS